MERKGYNDIADIYDDLFHDDYCVAENRAVSAMLTPYLYDRSILDVGCGTGLLLDLFSLNPKKYIGIDPSERMLDIAREKHPPFRFKQEKFEEYIGYTDVIVSLFGSMSYIDLAYLDKVQRVCAKYFLMFYKEDYVPNTYIKTGVQIEHEMNDRLGLMTTYFDGTVLTFQNYYIATNMFV